METRKALNIKAREEMKLRLIQDIAFDLEVCKIENWDYKEYLNEIKQIISDFMGDINE